MNEGRNRNAFLRQLVRRRLPMTRPPSSSAKLQTTSNDDEAAHSSVPSRGSDPTTCLLSDMYLEEKVIRTMTTCEKCSLLNPLTCQTCSARLLSSGEKKELGTKTAVPLNSDNLKLLNISTGDSVTDACVEGMDSTIGMWTCEKCTLLNPTNRQRCDACKARKPIMASSAYLESPASSLLRSASTSPQRFNTSEVVEPVETLKAPTTRKRGTCTESTENSGSYQTPKSSAHSKMEIKQKRQCLPVLSSECLERNIAKDVHQVRHGNVSESVHFKTAALKESKQTDQDECKENVLQEHKNKIENVHASAACHEIDVERPTSLTNEDYQQLQFTLSKVLNQLHTLETLVQTQKEEIRSLHEQNGEVLRMQNDILDQNREMKSSLVILGTIICASRPHSSVNNDAPSNVSPEVRHVSDPTTHESGVSSARIEATSSGTTCAKGLNGDTHNVSTSPVAMMLHSPTDKGELNKCTSNFANLDGLQCIDQPEKSPLFSNLQELEQKSTNHRRNEVLKRGPTISLTPLSPASTQTVDPDGSSQMSVPSKLFEPKILLSSHPLRNCTNQKVVYPALKAWTTNKNSRQFLSEMESELPREQSSPWKTTTTRSKLTSTAPFEHVSDQGQDDFLNESNQPKYAYKETVRCHRDRNGLSCHDCDECRKWYTTLKNTGHEFSQDPLGFSRHRSRFQPSETPVDFWEMSFVDERQARQVKEAGK